MFCWIIMMPQERWNIRSEKGPCARVTWLWYSSIGLMARLPYSSSWAYGPKTEAEENTGSTALGMNVHAASNRDQVPLISDI